MPTRLGNCYESFVARIIILRIKNNGCNADEYFRYWLRSSPSLCIHPVLLRSDHCSVPILPVDELPDHSAVGDVPAWMAQLRSIWPLSSSWSCAPKRVKQCWAIFSVSSLKIWLIDSIVLCFKSAYQKIVYVCRNTVLQQSDGIEGGLGEIFIHIIEQ